MQPRPKTPAPAVNPRAISLLAARGLCYNPLAGEVQARSTPATASGN